YRTRKQIAKTVKARDLWEKIGYAAWACADPGPQFHTTVNDWHTCPASGPIRASNPCSEYMFLDDTACNLASINLLPYRGEKTGYERVSQPPVRLDHVILADGTHHYAALASHARSAWDKALTLGEQHGYRNAQATVIAPTGTIGLVMDCDTTGIEPDFALVKFKKLAGGGYFKIIKRAVPEALRALGYSESEIAEIEVYAVGHGSLG